MVVEKIYRSLTKGEIGVYQGTKVDNTDGKITHILLVNGEEKLVSESTFKRWWKLVEETTTEDLEESVEQLNKIKDTVTKEQPTIEDLKALNDSGEELTEEELELFKQQAQKHTQNEEVIPEIELPSEDTTAEKVKEQKEKKAPEETDVVKFFQQTVYELGGTVKLYSEPAKRTVNDSKGKPVMFFMIGPKGVKLYLKETLDEALNCPLQVEEKHTYPKQYPFRLQVTSLDEPYKELLTNILKMYI